MKLKLFNLIFTLAVLFARSSGSGDSTECNCFTCFHEQTCSLLSDKGVALKMFLKTMFEHQLINQTDVDSVDGDVTALEADPCKRNKIEYLMAFLLDLPKPTPSKQCTNKSLCGGDECFSSLETFADWKILIDGCYPQEQFLMAKTLLNDTFTSIKQAILEKDSNVVREYSSETAVIDSVLKQKCNFMALKISDKINLILHILGKVLLCHENINFDAATETNNYKNETVQPLENKNVEQSPDTTTGSHENYDMSANQPPTLNLYLATKSSMCIQSSYAIHSYHPIIKNSTSSSQMCDGFADPYYFDKMAMLQRWQKSFLGCYQCPLDKKSDECQFSSLVSNIQEHHAKLKLISDMFERLLKCHFLDETCASRSAGDRSEDAFRFLIHTYKEIVECSKCNYQAPLKCFNTSSASGCEKMLVLPASTKYAIIENQFSSLSTCQDGISALLNSDETSFNGMSILRGNPFMNEMITFYKQLINILNLEETVTTSLEDGLQHTTTNKQESECSTVEQLRTKDCGSFLLKLKVKALLLFIKQANPSCNAIKTISGIPLCQSDLFDHIKDSCKDDLKSIKHFMFAAIGLLSNCRNDEFQSKLTQCSFLGSILGVRDQIFGEISSLEDFYKVKSNIRNILKIDSTLQETLKKLYEIERCSDKCPAGFNYCDKMQKCFPEWINCDSSDTSKPTLSYVTLPAMESTATYSAAVTVKDISTQGIAVFHEHNERDASGSWQYEIDSKWYNVNELPVSVAVKLSLDTKIRYYHFQKTFDYGLKVLHYFEDSSSKTVGERYDLPVNTVRKVVFMFIYPAQYGVDIKILQDEYVLDIEEDYHPPLSGGIRFDKLFNIDSQTANTVTDPIPIAYKNLIPREELSIFEARLSAFKANKPVLKLKSDIRTFGYLLISDSYNRVHGYLSHSEEFVGTDVKEGRISFFPKHNFNGNFKINLELCNCNAVDSSTKVSKQFSITVTVKPVNDVPESPYTRVYLPPISYDLSLNPNNGFTVEELLQSSYVKDAENGTDVSVAIYLTPSNTDIGKWEYQDGGNVWKNLSIHNSDDLFQAFFHKDASEEDQKKFQGTYIQYLTLDKTSKLRFSLNNNNTFWRQAEAIKSAFLVYSAWDQNDQLSTGFHNLTLEYLQTALAYSSPMIGLQLRNGCDNRPGSVAQIDACGKCGGNGKACLGCDNVKDSGAVLDDCGQCTGGTTKNVFNSQTDCAGTCGQSSIDECGQCQITNSKNRREFKDCNGVCFGRARIDSCGVCAGGNTDKNVNADMDACGKCFGDGTSCKGCDGVSKSGKVLDLCGNCLHPNDVLFNSKCVKIKSFEPSTAPSDGGIDIVVSGSGFKTDDISCSFSNESVGEIYNMISIKGSRTLTSFKLTLPNISPGYFTLKCWVGDTDGEELTDKRLYVYEVPTLSITGLTPDKVSSDEFSNVTVKGGDFFKTGEEICVVHDGRSNFMEFPLTIIDKTTAKCHINKPMKSVDGYLAVSLSKLHWSESLLKKLVSSSFMIHAPMPRVTRAGFSEDYEIITFQFSHKADCVTSSCEGLFSEETLKTFGQKYKMGFINRYTLAIKLGWQATLKPNDVITMMGSSIKPINQKVFTYTPDTQVSILPPKTALVTKAIIKGSGHIGPCSVMRLSATGSKGGGRGALEFNWDVRFPSSTNISLLDQATKDSLQDIKGSLSKLKRAQSNLRFSYNQLNMIPGVDYEFSLNVTNFLGQTSDTVRHVISRSNANAPAIEIFGGVEQEIKTGHLTKIKSKSRMPKCLSNMEKSLLDFSWDIESTDISLDEKSRYKSTLYIQPGTLKSNVSYSLTLTVALKHNPFVYTVTNVKLLAQGESLIPKIRGGNRKVSSNDIIKLDASRSFDPDKSDEREIFHWQCFDSVERECFVPDVNDTSKYVRLALPQQSKITIDKNVLEPGENYTFKLSYKKGNRESERNTAVEITASEPPQVYVLPQRERKEAVSKKVRVRAFVHSKTAGVRIWLEAVDNDEYGVINISDPNILATPIEAFKNRAGLFPFDVIFNPDVFTGGNEYKFMLFAQAGDDIGYGEIEFVANSPPSIGIFTSDNLNGTALTTDFTLDASEGWSDDIDDYPLTYTFGFITSKGHLHYLLPPTTESVVSVTLPSGDANDGNNLQLFVQVKDVHGASSRAMLNITVDPLEFVDESLLQNMGALIEEAKGSDDAGAVLSIISNTLTVFENALENNNTSQYPPTEKSLLEFKENSTRDVVGFMDSVQDAETQNVIIKNLRETSSGGESFSADVKMSVGSKISEVVKKQVFASSDEGSRRKRRSTDQSEANGKTKEEVEDILVTLSNTLNATDFTNNSMASKKTLTDLTSTLLTSLCNNIAYGETALTVTSKFATLQVYKHPFTNVDISPVSLGCDGDCGMATEVLFGESLQTDYRSWPCDGDNNCTGACIGSVIYPHDLFADNASVPERTGNIVSVHLFNPSTSRLIETGVQNTNSEFYIPFKNQSANSYGFDCEMWDDLKSSWSNANCYRMNTTKLIGGIHHAVCRCDSLGVVSIFEAEGATLGNVILERPDPSQYAQVEVRFLQSLATVMSKSGSTHVIESVKSTLAIKLSVEDWRISNITILNDTNVRFNFLPSDETKDYNAISKFNDNIETLKQLVKDGNLLVEFEDGSSSLLDSSFIDITIFGGSAKLDTSSAIRLDSFPILLFSYFLSVMLYFLI